MGGVEGWFYVVVFLVGSLLAAADCLPKVGHCYLYIMVGFHYERFSLSLLVPRERWRSRWIGSNECGQFLRNYIMRLCILLRLHCLEARGRRR